MITLFVSFVKSNNEKITPIVEKIRQFKQNGFGRVYMLLEKKDLFLFLVSGSKIE